MTYDDTHTEDDASDQYSFIQTMQGLVTLGYAAYFVNEQGMDCYLITAEGQAYLAMLASSPPQLDA